MNNTLGEAGTNINVMIEIDTTVFVSNGKIRSNLNDIFVYHGRKEIKN